MTDEPDHHVQAWVWKTQADFADALTEEDKPKQEVSRMMALYRPRLVTLLSFQTLAIRFATIDNAKAFETVSTAHCTLAFFRYEHVGSSIANSDHRNK